MQSVRLLRPAFVVVLAGASFVASAQIHRCKDEKGQTILSDRPCATADATTQQESSKNSGAVDRLSAPQMINARMRDMSAQYDFIPERGGRGAAAARQTK